MVIKYSNLPHKIVAVIDCPETIYLTYLPGF